MKIMCILLGGCIILPQIKYLINSYLLVFVNNTYFCNIIVSIVNVVVSYILSYQLIDTTNYKYFNGSFFHLLTFFKDKVGM